LYELEKCLKKILDLEKPREQSRQNDQVGQKRPADYQMSQTNEMMKRQKLEGADPYNQTSPHY